MQAQIKAIGHLRTGDRFLRLGFAGLGDAARELVGLSSRTARERVTLLRIFEASPEAERAYLGGRLSRCQILALGRVLRTRGISAAAWLAEAEGLSVREIRSRVRAWSDDEPHETEREGREIGFDIPATMTLAWEQGLEEARCELSEQAPVWRCLEAVLAETGFAGCGEPEEGQAQGGVDAGPAQDREADPDGVPRREPVPIHPPAVLMERARRDIETFEQHLLDVRDLLDAGSPRDAFDAVDRLRAIERLRAPHRIHLARLIRNLRDLGAARALGYHTLADLMTAELRIAERTAGRLIHAATVFDDAPILERQVGTGELSMGKALLAHRLSWGSLLPRYIARAREITHRAWEEEVQFLWLLRRCAPKVWERFSGPLPEPRLEAALIEEIRLWSRTPRAREAIEQDLNERFGALTPEGGNDPAGNPVILMRLRALLEQLVLLVWEDGEPLDRPTSATLGRTVRIRFWAPRPVAADFRAALRLVRMRTEPDGVETPAASRFPRGRARPLMSEWQAALVLLGTASRIWKTQNDPAAARTLRARILARDRGRCVAPGCTRRKMLEIHHGVFRSQGGDSAPENLQAACYGHHQRVLHQGYARLSGRAPQALVWELGCRPGCPPLLRLRGERILPEEAA